MPPAWRAALNSIRVRLLASFLVLIVVPLGLLGWFMLRALDQSYLDRLLDDLTAEAGLIGEAIGDELVAGQPVGVAELVHNPPPPLRTQARVIVFDAAGHLVATSGSSLVPLTDEPGLGQALGGTASRGVEQSPALAVPIAFVALPIVANDRVVGVVHLAYLLADIENELSTLRTWVVLAVVLVSVVALILGIELSRRIVRPLDQLRAATEQVARGHFDQRVSEAAPTEVAAVARNFNRMASALLLTEQARQVMFANLAHDVRTPLGSIRAAAEALAGGAAEQPELREKLTAGLIAQITYLRHFTDDLLRLATYEGGGLVLRRTLITVASLLQTAADSWEMAAAEHGVTIQVEPGPGELRVYADADRLLEVLLNLLDNALQYTPAGGNIQLKVTLDTGRPWVVLHVIDDGPGIPHEALPTLFERYRRGDSRRAGSGLNMGLGLSIAYAIVAAHQGTLTAANLPAGGADFTISLPLA